MQGNFRKGNTAAAGRAQPHYDRNITRDVKAVLAEHGSDGESWSRKIVRAMAKQASHGNVKAAEWLADRAEGKAIQRIDVDVMRKAELLAEMYDLDPAEVVSMARQIAEEEEATSTPLLAEPDTTGGVPDAQVSKVVDAGLSSEDSETP